MKTPEERIAELELLIKLANDIMPAIAGYENVDPALVSPYLIAHERIMGVTVPGVDPADVYTQEQLDAELARRAKP